MIKKIEVHLCDGCQEESPFLNKYNIPWYDNCITQANGHEKPTIWFGGNVINTEIELCPKCSEKFISTLLREYENISTDRVEWNGKV